MKFLFTLYHLKLIQIIVSGTALLGLYFFAFYDNGSLSERSIEQLMSNIKQKDVKIEKLEEQLVLVKKIEQSFKEDQAQVNKLLSFIPKKLTYTDISILLNKEANDSGINIENRTDQAATQNDNAEYQILKIQLKIKGSFVQIMLFLSRLTSQDKLIIVKKIDMQIQDKTSLIVANLSVEAYRYNEKNVKNKKTP